MSKDLKNQQSDQAAQPGGRVDCEVRRLTLMEQRDWIEALKKAGEDPYCEETDGGRFPVELVSIGKFAGQISFVILSVCDPEWVFSVPFRNDPAECVDEARVMLVKKLWDEASA